MITVCLIFSGLLVFVLLYFAAFEKSRYKFARMMADGLGGKAVFKISGSYMKRVHGGAEERVWVVPDKNKAWGDIKSIFSPAANMLCLFKDTGPVFRFYIEPKTGMLFRPISLGGIKNASFNVPQLDEVLSLRTNGHDEAGTYFLSSKKYQALLELFNAGFAQVRGDSGGIVATMKDVSRKDLEPERVDVYLEHLRAL